MILLNHNSFCLKLNQFFKVRSCSFTKKRPQATFVFSCLRIYVFTDNLLLKRAVNDI